MSNLPKIDYPVHKINIPSLKKDVQFRPFLVKEEKILLLAIESKNNEQIYTAIKSILGNCIKTKLDIENLPYFDVEYLFIQLRMKSMGEVVEIIVTDPSTKEKFETVMDLNKIQIEGLDKNKIKNYKINFTKDSGVIVEYPSFKEFSSTANQNKSKDDIIFDFACGSIKTIFSKDKVIKRSDVSFQEIHDFLESLPKSYYKKITTYFDKTPTIIYKDSFKSPTTGNDIPVIVRNFESFFT